MSKLTNAEKEKLDNTCGNLRVTKLGTHVKSIEDFLNEMNLDTQANTVAEAINELYGMIVNNDCATIQIPPPGFFTLFGNDEDGKLYCYYNNEDYPPVFRHVETPGELEGTLYLYIADPEGENHYEIEVGHYIAVKHLDDYYTKTQINSMFTVTVEKQQNPTSGYAATYVIKQGGTALSPKINIPKDFLVKRGEVKTCTTANVPIQGLQPGDKYLDFIVNAKDSSATDEHIYIDVHDLGVTYTADESTLTLSNNRQFSVKNGGITMSKLATDVQDAINSKADEGSFEYTKVTALADHPTGTVDHTVYYLTIADPGWGFEPGFYVWDTAADRYVPFHHNGKEDKSNKVTSISSSSTNTQYPSAKLVYDQLALKADKSSLATVATSGDYDDLTDKPTKLSDFTNDEGFITEYSLEYTKVSALADHPDGTIDDTLYYLTEASGGHEQGFYVWDYDHYVPFHHNGKEDKSNKVTSLSSSSTNTQYPSAKVVYDQLALKQDASSLATVATSGDYDDLVDKPTKLSDFTNDEGFITESSFSYEKVSVLVDKTSGTVDDTVYYLTTTDLYGNYEPGFYVWDYDHYVPFHHNGKEDKTNKVTSLSSSSTNTQYPSAKLVYDQLSLKQDKSSAFSGNYNDLTNKPSIPTKTSDLNNDSGFITQHQDITGKEDKSNKVTSLSSSSTDTQYPSAKCVFDELEDKLDVSDAFSGNYNDLTNKPSIPTKTSDLTNDGDGNNDFVTKSTTSGLIKNDGTIDTNTYLTQHQNISGKEDTTNKVTSWTSTTTNTHYPSEKLVKDTLDEKVDGITFIGSISDAVSDGIYILPEFSLLTEDLEMTYRDGSQFVATLTKNGEPYAVGGVVIFTISNQEYKRTIGANGQAKTNITLQIGTYTITTEFRGKINTNTIIIH